MKITDEEIKFKLTKQFTPIKGKFEDLINKYELESANLFCWVPHEVSSIVQLGWEDGLVEDMEHFLADTIPPGKWTKHDEPGTPFEKNFYQHAKAKVIGNISITLLVTDGKLYLGKYQDLYFFSPVYKEIPDQMIYCRILKLD